MENYFESQRDQIFRGVEVLIYVFDIESQDRKKDMDNFASCLDAIKQGSKNAHIFALIHKMDLIHKDDERLALFEERAAELRKMADPLRITCFGTSIWDETLYKAWSSIVYALVPNVDVLESNLDKLCRLCEADEIVMFEKATFLVISHATHRAHEDVHRYEKASTRAHAKHWHALRRLDARIFFLLSSAVVVRFVPFSPCSNFVSCCAVSCCFCVLLSFVPLFRSATSSSSSS